VKRAIDVFAALAGLAVLAPALALIALAVWLEDCRSPWYRGKRVARGGGTFRMLKFRTMVPNAFESGVNSTAADDRRVTRTGSWLRRTKLDELPQLINVVRGEMSLVGPRPQIPEEVEMYTGEERRTLTVRPGMTDLASIVFADEARILEGSADPDLLYHQIVRPWKSRLALFYVDRAVEAAEQGARSTASSGRGWFKAGSVDLDLRILALTFTAMIRRERALAGVRLILEQSGVDEMLRRMAGRREALIPYPAPGASEIVGQYRPRAVGA
jgi:lipopolysaccharide/colanic/teichoic acid biosynthesis glycosyltransferase